MTMDPFITASALVLGLPGGGVAPAVFDTVVVRSARLLPFDWMALPGPADPVSVADALAQRLRTRRAGAPDSGPIVLAGHSLGGVIALLCAIRQPDLISALVISNTGPRIGGHGDPDLPKRIRESWSPAMRCDFLASCFDRAPEPQFFAQLEAWMAAVDVERFLQAVIGLRQLDLTADLALIRCPVLIAHGERDRRRRVSDAQALANGIPDSQLVLLPAGHTPMVDTPTIWSAAVDAFLESRLPEAALQPF